MHQTILFLLQKEHSSKICLVSFSFEKKRVWSPIWSESNTNAQGFNEISKEDWKDERKVSYSATSARLAVLRDPSEWRRMKDATHVSSCVTIPSSPIENPSGFQIDPSAIYPRFSMFWKVAGKTFSSPQYAHYDILKCFHVARTRSLLFCLFDIRDQIFSWEMLVRKRFLRSVSSSTIIPCWKSLLSSIFGRYSSVCFLMCSKRNGAMQWPDNVPFDKFVVSGSKNIFPNLFSTSFWFIISAKSLTEGNQYLQNNSNFFGSRHEFC